MMQKTFINKSEGQIKSVGTLFKMATDVVEYT